MSFAKDKFGALGQLQPDGDVEMGDSANWTGHYIYLTDDERINIDYFKVGYGAYVRHPLAEATNSGFGAYYKNPWDGCMSRDQITGVLAAIIKKKEYKLATEIVLHHALRLFLFSYNTRRNGVLPKIANWKMPDITIFDLWSMEIRALHPIIGWALWPVLNVFDVWMVLQVIVFNYFTKEKDPISFAMKMIVMHENKPTLTGELAWLLLNKYKLNNFIRLYWSGWRSGNIGMKELYYKKLLPGVGE